MKLRKALSQGRLRRLTKFDKLQLVYTKDNAISSVLKSPQADNACIVACRVSRAIAQYQIGRTRVGRTNTPLCRIHFARGNTIAILIIVVGKRN